MAKGIKHTDIKEDYSWAQVELFRWQYGCLPGDNDFRKINLPEAFSKASRAILEGKVSPYNASQMMSYAAFLFLKHSVGVYEGAQV